MHKRNSIVETLSAYKSFILVLSFLTVCVSTVALILLLRLIFILSRPTPSLKRPLPSEKCPTHLLVVLGSGGHTAEMLNILSSIPDLSRKFTYRTYLVSSGDGFSALKAKEFEGDSTTYSIVTVRRARRVHQSFSTTPFTTLLSFWDCLQVLRGAHPDMRQRVYPDLILTNGPGTGVCVVIASIALMFLGFQSPSETGSGQMRTIFIESWARVKTLSLSGKILRPIVSRFLVQWPQLAELYGNNEGGGGNVEYTGPLVS